MDDAPHWRLLTPAQAIGLAGVPEELARAPGARFYELSSRPRSDPHSEGPWPLLHVRDDPDAPGVVRVQIATIDGERPGSGRNALADAGGYLFLTGAEMESLARVLSDAALSAGGRPEEGPGREPPLRRLDPGELAGQGLDDEVAPGERQSFHVQPEEPTGEPTRAAVVFSEVLPLPAQSLFFALRRVAAEPGGEPGEGLRSAGAYVNLDGPGLVALVDLLRNELEHVRP